MGCSGQWWSATSLFSCSVLILYFLPAFTVSLQFTFKITMNIFYLNINAESRTKAKQEYLPVGWKHTCSGLLCVNINCIVVAGWSLLHPLQMVSFCDYSLTRRLAWFHFVITAWQADWFHLVIMAWPADWFNFAIMTWPADFLFCNYSLTSRLVSCCYYDIPADWFHVVITVGLADWFHVVIMAWSADWFHVVITAWPAD